jgi:uncharacterized protein (UPF0332 family)
VALLHDDLLEQAIHLANREQGRPRQASLRRAISTAYYALFHLLAYESAHLMAPRRPTRLRAQVQRAFDHGHMNRVCKQFAQGSQGALSEQTQKLVTATIEPEIARVASVFVALQEARHTVDYDVTARFSRLSVLRYIAVVQRAFRNWNRVRGRRNAKVFLAALLLQDRWGR